MPKSAVKYNSLSHASRRPPYIATANQLTAPTPSVRHDAHTGWNIEAPCYLAATFLSTFAGAFAKNSSCTALTPRLMSSVAMTHDMVISEELMQSTLIFSRA